MVTFGWTKQSTHQGFTLVELLIATAVGVLILFSMVAYWTNTLNVTSLAVASRTSLEDLRSTGNYISDMINQAGYVFPPKAKIKLAAASASAYTVKNPNDGTAIWTVGTDPIIAMFIPPQDSSATSLCNATVTLGCTTFMAFYSVKRSDVMTNATGAEKPNDDPRVPNAFTLYQYILNIAPVRVTNKPDVFQNFLISLKTAGTLNNYAPTGSSGNLLADYIAPDKNDVTKSSFVLGNFECYVEEIDLTKYACPTTAPLAIKSVRAVDLSLQGQIARDNGGSLTRIPNDPMVYRPTPRNLRSPFK